MSLWCRAEGGRAHGGRACLLSSFLHRFLLFVILIVSTHPLLALFCRVMPCHAMLCCAAFLRPSPILHTHTHTGLLQPSAPLQLLNHIVGVRPALVDAAYGVDMVVPGAGGLLRLVGWYSPGRGEGGLGLRLM